MKRLIQWRPYYLQHQREVSLPPLSLSLVLTFFLFQHSPLSALFLFSPPLSVAPIYSWNMCTCRVESVRSELSQFDDKGVPFVLIMTQTMCTSNVAQLQCCTLHLRGLINDYLHVEINQYGNCANPVPISSGIFIKGFCMMGLYVMINCTSQALLPNC